MFTVPLEIQKVTDQFYFPVEVLSIMNLDQYSNFGQEINRALGSPDYFILKKYFHLATLTRKTMDLGSKSSITRTETFCIVPVLIPSYVSRAMLSQQLVQI